MNIPIAKPYLGNEEEMAAVEAIRSGWVSQGPKVKEFEDKFAEYVGARYAVATTSCTTALHAALAVLGIGSGDEVIVPSLSFIATANSVIHAGAQPVFADIDPETCNITAGTIEKVITPKTKAVMPVHQMGLPADLDPIMDLCKTRGLILIEDAACAIGSEYKGSRIGGHGNIACFSFHPRKIITTGEGGMITTDNQEIAERLKRFRHHGMSVSDIERHATNKVIIEKYQEIGYNFRMTDIQAAIGIEQLKRLPFILERRRQIAKIYDKELGGIPYLKVPKIPDYVLHNYQSYWFELLDSSPISRDDLIQKLLDAGVSTRRGIMAIHMEKCYERGKNYLPNTERISKKSIIIPLYVTMTKDELLKIILIINKTLKAS